jgi:hypothetical protein
MMNPQKITAPYGIFVTIVPEMTGKERQFQDLTAQTAHAIVHCLFTEVLERKHDF